jgi:hypothetical protein
MKNGADITRNTFNAGLEPQEGFWHAVGKAVDLVDQPVKHALGRHPLRTDDDTIVLQGNREDYDFKFNDEGFP